MQRPLTLRAMPISDRITDDAAATARAPFVDGLAGDLGAFRALVAERVLSVRERIEIAQARSGRSQSVTVIAVTKTHGPEAVEAACAAGVSDVGENKVQEAVSKRALVRASVRWHLIGHVQRNKAQHAATFDMIHGVDSVRLAQALDAAALAANRVLDVLVQVNVSGESSKGGFAPSDVSGVAAQLDALPHLRVCGVMTMAPFDAPEMVLREVFSGARRVRDALLRHGHPSSVLSMGMSDDFEVAVEEGATHVRLGSVLFGHRLHQ